MEEYEEVETEYEDFTAGDIVFMGAVVIGACVLIAFVAYIIRKTFKNVHLKLGNKIEIGVETKEN
ncbi:MAG: hypothetical protein IKS48_00155 [Eubacterium sp.]|nr:hypothetical protein [Eubacterium sp.]